MDKDAKKEFSDLARMIKKGFDHTDKQLEDFKRGTNKRFNVLEQGQEDIKLRLDNTAPQFEVDDLKKRVGKLEFKQVPLGS